MVNPTKSETTLKFNVVKEELRKIGVTIRKTGEGTYGRPEMVVKLASDKNPEHGYYTDDLEDALDTGKAMAQHQRGGAATATDLIPSKTERSAITASDQSIAVTAATNNIPSSPLSNRPMKLTKVGAFGQPPFDAWVHLDDRIVLPHRAG